MVQQDKDPALQDLGGGTGSTPSLGTFTRGGCGPVNPKRKKLPYIEKYYNYLDIFLPVAKFMYLKFNKDLYTIY